MINPEQIWLDSFTDAFVSGYLLLERSFTILKKQPP